MKRVLLLITTLLLLMPTLSGQKVDSIKVEQSGDFVKIRYKILNSNPNQLFRVKVVYSVNGGLNIEPRSLSGDAGDNIVGGKSEYFVIWDVLKDVEELGSAEFIVRAELINDLAVSTDKVNKEEISKWEKKKFYVQLASEFDGPLAGLRIGYMGRFGISGQYVYGKMMMNESPAVAYSPGKKPAMSLDVSARIINKNSFQMHLMAGIQRTKLIFSNPVTLMPYSDETVLGPEVGFSIGIKSFAFSILVAHLDPGQIEKGTDLSGVSPSNYVSSSIGVRF